MTKEFSSLYNLREEQAGAELYEAQAQVGLTAEAELILMFYSLEDDFHLFKIVSDSTRVDRKKVLLIPS